MIFLIVLAVLVVLVVVEAVLTEVEYWGWATTLLLGTLVGFHFLHIWSVVDFVKTYTLEALAGVGIYVVAGIVWSFIKWFSFLMGFRDTYRQKKEEFITRKKAAYQEYMNRKSREAADDTDLPEYERRVRTNRRGGEESIAAIGPMSEAELSELFVKEMSGYETYRGNSLSSLPKAAHNKARITSWACFWPFSMLGTIINDPVRRLWNLMWGHLKALYQHMADRLFASHPELK